MGIEPTGPPFPTVPPDLKSGEGTSPHALPSSYNIKIAVLWQGYFIDHQGFLKLNFKWRSP